MVMVPMEGLGDIGIVLDLPSYELPPAGFSSGNNIRFFQGKVQKIKGHEAVFGTPTVAPHWLLPWETLTEDRWIYAGTAQVYRTYNSIHTNITRYTTTQGDNDYTAGTRPIWTGGNLHGVPILNHDNFTDPPQQWDGALSRLKDLDNWPASTWAKVIRPFKNFLIALFVRKGSTDYPYMVKWSHPADPGTVPTSWDETDATKLAGEQTIAQSGGFLVDCLPLSGRNVVYKTDSIWEMVLSGGTNVFTFNILNSTLGALGTNCIATLNREHFIVGQDDIVLFNGVTPRTVVNNRVRNWFFGSLHPSHWDKTVVTVHNSAREVWIAFVEVGAPSEYCTRALIWNWDTNTYSTRVLPDITFIDYGVVSSAATETFDSDTGQFNEAIGPFDSASTPPTALQMLMSKAYTTAELLHGDETYQAGGNNYTSYVERVGLPIAGVDAQGRVKVDPASVKFVRAVFPKISAPQGAVVKISVGAQDHIDGPVQWEGPYNFVVGETIKLDFNVVGRYIAYRVEDSGSLPWELSGITFDLDVISRY